MPKVSTALPLFDHEVVERSRRVEQRVGLSRTAIYRLRLRGEFPAPIRLTPKTIGWRASEVTNWIDERQRVR